MNGFILAYKQCKKEAADWSRNRTAHSVAELEAQAEKLKEPPYIQIVAIYTLDAWHFGRPAGEPMWKWEREG